MLDVDLIVLVSELLFTFQVQLLLILFDFFAAGVKCRMPIVKVSPCFIIVQFHFYFS